MSSKSDYIEFCKYSAADIPVFAEPWYLDAVMKPGEEWDVINYYENNRVIAAFPYAVQKNKLGMVVITNPWMAPRLGLLLSGETKRTRSLSKVESLENKIIEEVIAQLPKFDDFNMICHSGVKNWMEFYRHDYEQTCYYSYIIDRDKTKDEIVSDYISNKRRIIKKHYGCVEIHKNTISPDEYWEYLQHCYKKRNRLCSYTKEQFIKLMNSIQEHEAGDILSMYSDNNLVCAAIIFYDKNRAYHMMTTFDPENGIRGQDLLTHYAIIDANSRGLIFDFEGSMIPGVAEFNRSFGGQKEEYYVITKQSKKMKGYKLLKGILNR